MKTLDLNEKNTEDNDDHNFFESKFTIFVIVVLEITLFIKGYLYCSPIIKANSTFFPFVKTYHQDVAEVIFDIENLTSRNRFIQLDIVFHRYRGNTDILMKGEYNLSLEFFLNNQSVAYKPNQHNQLNTRTYIGYINFIPQKIFYEPIINFDKIRSNLTIYTNLTELKGMNFDYFYVNSNFIILYAYISIILTILTVFSLTQFIVFCSSKHFDLSNNDKFLIALNILAVLSSIDYQHFFNEIQLYKLTILVSDIMIVIFRIYTVYLLDSLINHSNSISENVNTEMISYLFLFVALIYHDHIQFNSTIFARLDERPRFSIPMIRLLILFFHIWYILIMSYYLIKAHKDSNKYTKEKASLYGKYIIFNMVNTFIVKILLMFHYIHDNSALNLFVYRFSHIITIVIMTSIRTESKHHTDEYQKVDNENVDANDNALFPLNSDDDKIVVEDENGNNN